MISTDMQTNICNMDNSTLYELLSFVQHEIYLSEKCIQSGDEVRK